MKIIHRFILFVSLPVLGCLVAMSVFLHVLSSRALEAEHDRRLLAIARQARGLMAGEIDRVKSDLVTLLASGLLDRYFMYADVSETDFAEDVRASLEEHFLAVSKAKPEYSSLGVIRLDGAGIVNITEQRTMYRYPDPRQAAWFKAAINSNRGEIVCVSVIAADPEHQVPAIFVTQMVYYRGQPRAVAVIQLHCQPFFVRLLRELSCGGSHAYLVDDAGRIIAHADPALASAFTPAADPGMLATVLAGQERIIVEPELTSTALVKNVYLPLGLKGAVLVVGQPLAELEAITGGLRNHLILISVLVALGLVVLIYATVKTIVRPLARLQSITGRIAGGELDARVAISRPDEIGSLAASFDAMAENLQSSRNRLQSEINERRQVAEELRQAKATLETIFNNVIPLCITNRDFEVINANEAYNGVFGKPAEGKSRMKCYDSRPGSSCRTPNCALYRILEGHEQEVSCEVTKRDREGHERVFIMTARPFMSADSEILGVVQSFQDISARKQSEEERSRLIAQLQEALARVKLLSGFLSICSSCKKIRDDKGYWKQIESYIREHSEAEFSHGICPECAKKHYPEFNLYPEKQDEGG